MALTNDYNHMVLLVPQVAVGNSLELVGFTIAATSPSASTLPVGTQQLLNITFSDATYPVLNPFGSLLPNFLAFPAPKTVDNGTAVIRLLDMQLVYDTCDSFWLPLTKTLSIPQGVGDSDLISWVQCHACHLVSCDAMLCYALCS